MPAAECFITIDILNLMPSLLISLMQNQGCRYTYFEIKSTRSPCLQDKRFRLMFAFELCTPYVQDNILPELQKMMI